MPAPGPSAAGSGSGSGRRAPSAAALPAALDAENNPWLRVDGGAAGSRTGSAALVSSGPVAVSGDTGGSAGAKELGAALD